MRQSCGRRHPPPPLGRTLPAMAAMCLSSACVRNAHGHLSSRRATSNTRLTGVRSVRAARSPGLKVHATVSKDNVFANNPGSLEALNNLTVDSASRPPLTLQAPDDFSTMPHKERLKVFSGSAHPELSDVRALFPKYDLFVFRTTSAEDSSRVTSREPRSALRSRQRTGNVDNIYRTFAFRKSHTLSAGPALPRTHRFERDSCVQNSTPTLPKLNLASFGFFSV